MSSVRALRSLLTFCLLCLLGCSGDDEGGAPPDAGADAGRGGAAGRAGSAEAGSGGRAAAGRGGTGGLAGNAGTAGAAGTGDDGPERCDGRDNDANGVIDDVDAEGDGVCDCLSIATLGAIGPWSDGGNVFKDWLNSRSPTAAVELGDQVLTDELLAPFQVIVVLYVATMELTGNGRTLAPHHEFTPDEVAAFERWVLRGGGVMTTIGYTGSEVSEMANVNRLLERFGMGYSPSKLDVNGFAEDWIEHPLTGGVQKIYTENGAEPDGPNGTTLARDSSNRVALQASQARDGHVVVWGDEWITYDSQWLAVQDQQVERLWLNTLKWLSPTRVCQVAIPGPD